MARRRTWKTRSQPSRCYPELGRDHEDHELARLSARKASKSRSRVTKKVVADSFEQVRIERELSSEIQMSVGLVAPPRLLPDRIRRLAWFHLQGFFYLITYDKTCEVEGYPPGECGWVNEAGRSDWGNALQCSFARLTADWDSRVEGVARVAFSELAIRREPLGSELWSFALEWNRSLRSIGFFGDLALAQPYVNSLSPLQFMQIDRRADCAEKSLSTRQKIAYLRSNAPCREILLASAIVPNPRGALGTPSVSAPKRPTYVTKTF